GLLPKSPHETRTTELFSGRESKRSTRQPESGGSVASDRWRTIGLPKRRRQVALAEAARDRDDLLPPELWTFGDSQRGAHVRASRDAGKDAFLLCESTRPLERFVIADGLHPVQQSCVAVLGNESCANALNLVRARLSA